jgi:hypothetical protein
MHGNEFYAPLVHVTTQPSSQPLRRHALAAVLVEDAALIRVMEMPVEEALSLSWG